MPARRQPAPLSPVSNPASQGKAPGCFPNSGQLHPQRLRCQCGYRFQHRNSQARPPLDAAHLSTNGLGPPKTKRDLGMAEQTFDARRMARDEESRMAAAALAGLHVINYQASFLRMWADNAELFARNYERGLEDLQLRC